MSLCHNNDNTAIADFYDETMTLGDLGRATFFNVITAFLASIVKSLKKDCHLGKSPTESRALVNVDSLQVFV